MFRKFDRVSFWFIGNARIVYERAVEFYGDDNMDESLFIAFARFEENQREVFKLFLTLFQQF